MFLVVICPGVAWVRAKVKLQEVKASNWDKVVFEQTGRNKRQKIDYNKQCNQVYAVV